MTLKELVAKRKRELGLTTQQAKLYVAQEVILRKINASEYADRVLLKGGVVMFNITKSARRATKDMDFDVIRYDISDEKNLKEFVYCLNKYKTEWKVKYLNSTPFHQDDYNGSKISILVYDDSLKIYYTIDIGVHTMYEISQDCVCFDFGEKNDEIEIHVNPVEQMIAEKLFSLSKHGSLSGRYKDISDIYYLILNHSPNIEIVNKCFELMLPNEKYNINDVKGIINRVSEALNDPNYIKDFEKSKANWLDVKYETMKDSIISFLTTTLK